MTNGNDSAYVIPPVLGHSEAKPGLTKRELFSMTFAMKLLDRTKIQIGEREVSHFDAAVVFADELIDSLNRIEAKQTNKTKE